MSLLFPPILESQRVSIPAQLTLAQQTDFRIPITMPLSVDRTKIGHIQVLIKRQVDMRPWVSVSVPNTVAPEKTVIYLPPTALGTNDIITVSKNYLQLFSAGDIISPVGAEQIAAQTGRIYTIQVRFGDTPLWTGTTFATWNATNIANNSYGEWSNTQKMFVFGVAPGDLNPDGTLADGALCSANYNNNSLTGFIDWQYSPISQDPLMQVRINYSWSTPDSYQNQFRARNCPFNNTDGRGGGANGSIETNIARFAQIQAVIRFTTSNNTVFDKIITIPAFDFTKIAVATNTIQPYPVLGEEIEDGVLAMMISGRYQAAGGVSPLIYRLFRVDVSTLETILLTSFDQSVLGGTALSEIVKDYSVEMGAEYAYIAIGYTANGNYTYVFSSVTNLIPTNWNPPLYQGYGRQTNFQGNIFLTGKYQQLRLKGNITVGNFQRNVSDQITTTIGGAYPFFARSSQFNYRTMSLQGLITMNFDTTHTFLSFRSQESAAMKDLKASIALDYQKAAAALRTTGGNYSEKLRELQLTYYAQLQLIYEGRNPYTGAIFETPSWSNSGQLWLTRNEDTQELVVRTPDLFSMEEYSPNIKRRSDRYDPINEALFFLDDHDGFIQSSTAIARTYNRLLGHVRGPSTRYDYQNRKDTTEVINSIDRQDSLIYSERKFREAVMQWIANGEPKIFRSETEGNMIVILTGATFAPLNKSRLVYQLSATVTEIAEYNLDNLLLYNLVPVKFNPFYIPNIEFGFTPGDVDINLITSY